MFASACGGGCFVGAVGKAIEGDGYQAGALLLCALLSACIAVFASFDVQSVIERGQLSLWKRETLFSDN
jgi:hypothetical protein